MIDVSDADGALGFLQDSWDLGEIDGEFMPMYVRRQLLDAVIEMAAPRK